MKCVDSAELGKAKRIVGAPGRYIEFCKSTIPPTINFHGMKIVVDCANGATYHIAPHVFMELGAEVIEVGVNPDGFNINDMCGSTRPEIVQKIVLDEKADLGIAFDGDGDRVVMVDNCGEFVDGDELLFIMAQHLHHKKKLHGGVVGTVMSNFGLEKALQGLGIPFERTKVGDRHVMSMLKQLGWHLGGESSGHLINLHLTTTGDGIISALQVLRAICQQQKDLHTLKSGMQKYPQCLVNVKITQPIDISSQHIQSAVDDAQTQLGDSGRILLRESGTEPVIRVMVEGEQLDQVNLLAQELADIVRGE